MNISARNLTREDENIYARLTKFMGYFPGKNHNKFFTAKRRETTNNEIACANTEKKRKKKSSEILTRIIVLSAKHALTEIQTDNSKKRARDKKKVRRSSERILSMDILIPRTRAREINRPARIIRYMRVPICWNGGYISVTLQATQRNFSTRFISSDDRNNPREEGEEEDRQISRKTN